MSVDHDAVERTLRERIVPLGPLAPDGDTIDPDASHGALATVDTIVRDAAVLGVGEQSHGSKECVQFRDHLLRYLVLEHGCRHLVLEASVAAGRAVDEYLTTGEGSLGDALEGDGIAPHFHNESLRDALEWLRSFNRDRPREDHVRVHGMDVQASAPAVDRLESFFQRVDPDALEPIADDLDRLRTAPPVRDEDRLATHLDARASVVDAFDDALETNEAAYADVAGDDAVQWARRFVWALDRGRDQFRAIAQRRTDTGANVRIRDSAMAAQICWLHRRYDAELLVAWGHNAHLARGWFAGANRNDQQLPSLGANLAQLDGIDYRVLGTFVGGGTVGAMNVPDEEYTDYQLEGPQDGSLRATFERVDEIPFLLPLRDVQQDSPLGRWLDSRPRRRTITGGYRRSPVDRVDSDLRRQFDAVAFLGDSTTAERIGKQ